MITTFKFFMTPMCPDCGEIKEYLTTISFKGEIIDATTDEGLEESQNLGVMGVPCMVFLDNNGKEETRATDIDEIKNVIENKSLLDV